jgi:hypothetical protein
VQHVQPLERPFPWRAATVAACILALAELVCLIALVGVGLIHIHHTGARPTSAATQGAPPTTKPVVHQLRPRSRVSVLVLNGNGVAHAAGTEATQLLSQGYRRTLAADAASSYARSLVLFRPGWEREAHRLARDAGISTATPLDVHLPSSDAAYQLVLILGAR